MHGGVLKKQTFATATKSNYIILISLYTEVLGSSAGSPKAKEQALTDHSVISLIEDCVQARRAATAAAAAATSASHRCPDPKYHRRKHKL